MASSNEHYLPTPENSSVADDMVYDSDGSGTEVGSSDSSGTGNCLKIKRTQDTENILKNVMKYDNNSSEEENSKIDDDFEGMELSQGRGEGIIFCHTCPRSYLFCCLDLGLNYEAQGGKWRCPTCEKIILNGSEGNVDDIENNRIIYKKGQLLCCDICSSAYHPHCIDLPIDEIPDHMWTCPRCACEPLVGEVEKVITWRWTGMEDKVEVLHKEQNIGRNGKIAVGAQREFLIKWREMSYWHCSWVREYQLKVTLPRSYLMYLQMTDMNDKPMIYDVEDTVFRRVKYHDDFLNMFKTFYRYGIKPAWLQPNRVLNRRKGKDGTVQYLVKWTGLEYADSTWEDQNEKIPDLQTAIRDYEDLRYVCGADGRKKQTEENRSDEVKRKYHVPPVNPITDLNSVYKDNSMVKWLPDGLALQPYQLKGISWARQRWHNNLDILLADEVDKTIQAITFLYSLYMEGHSKGPFLVVVPFSTLSKWEREFAVWAPEFYVVSYVGGEHSRMVIRENELSFEDYAVRKGCEASRLMCDTVKFHCILTTYELIYSDARCLGSIHWEVLVVDEANILEHNKSHFCKTLARYSVAYKMLLTATPLNNLEGFFHIVNFLTPYVFYDFQEFLLEFDSMRQMDRVLDLLHWLGPHILRRLEEDVL